MDGLEFKDDGLIDRLKAGDQVAFTRLYNEYRKRLYYYVFKLTDNSFQSLSIVNEVFEKLWRLRQNFAVVDDLRAFMYVAARNAAYDFLRQTNSATRKIEVVTIDPDAIADSSGMDTMDNQVLETELYARLYAELSNLPARQRQLIRMVLDRKSNEEISHSLGINVTAVRQLKKRAIINLRKRLLPFVFLYLFPDL